MTSTIRPITPTEAACILPLLEQVHAIHVEAHPDHFPADPDRDELLAFLRDRLSNDAITALVAFGPDGAAVGYLLCEIETRAPSLLSLGERRGMLHHISVDQAWRRSGIGLALIEDMKARLRAQGIARVVTIYGAFNGPSAALMRRAGLEPFNIIAAGST